MTYNEIIADIGHRIHSFAGRHGLKPNIIVMSNDVWGLIQDYTNNYVTTTLTDESKRQIFRIDVSVVEQSAERVV